MFLNYLRRKFVCLFESVKKWLLINQLIKLITGVVARESTDASLQYNLSHENEFKASFSTLHSRCKSAKEVIRFKNDLQMNAHIYTELYFFNLFYDFSLLWFIKNVCRVAFLMVKIISNNISQILPFLFHFDKYLIIRYFE